MDEDALLGIINALKNQIIEIKGSMREQQKKEIEDLEAAHENEKYLIEQKCQEDVEGYKYIISQQKNELERLEHDNEEKDNTIGDLEKNLNDKEDEFQQKLQEFKTKAENYDFLQNRFDEKVEEIKELNGKLIKKKEKYKKYKNEESIPLYDKGNYDEVNICSNEFSDDKKDFAIETTRRILKTYDNHFQSAKDIKSQFENKYGGNWTVILLPRGFGHSCFTYFDKCFISFKMGEYLVQIALTHKKDTINLYDKGNYYEVDIRTNEMSYSQKNFAIETTRKSLNMYNDHFDCVKYIKEQFESEYKGNWIVILSTRGYGSSNLTYFDKCYICFTMGEFLVKIAKTHRKDTIDLYDKGNYYEVDIRTNEMSYSQKNFAIETTRKSLNMYNDHFDCAKYIKEQFESEYKGNWIVILSTRGYGSSNLTYFDKCYICFTMGEFLVKIAKTQRKDTITLSDKGYYYNVNVLTNKMYNYQKDFAIETTRNGLKKYSSHFECAKYIKSQFDSNYSGTWSVILIPRGYGDSYCTYYDDCYISFIMGEFCVRIFKSSM